MLILGAPPVKILNRYILENIMQYSIFDFYTFNSLSFFKTFFPSLLVYVKNI